MPLKRGAHPDLAWLAAASANSNIRAKVHRFIVEFLMRASNKPPGHALHAPGGLILHSECQSQSETELAFVVFGASDGQEITTRLVATGIEKVGCVKEVSGICSELKFYPFGDLKRPE